MNVGLGINLAAFARAAAPSQGQVNQQVAMAGGSAALYAQDCVVKKANQDKTKKLMGNKASQKNVLDKAGITKVNAAKKR